MRRLLGTVAVALVLANRSSSAQQTEPEPAASDLTGIRKALSQPVPIPITPPEPTFRVTVEARALFSQPQRQIISVPKEPVPPGGLYAFEERQRLGNPWAGQPLIQVDMLPLLDKVRRAVGHAHRAHLERLTPETVARELAEFCVVNVCR